MPSIHEPVTLLREDHLLLTQLFKAFCAMAAREDSPSERRAVVEQIILRLETHLRTVEDVVWPSLYEEHPGEAALDKAEVTHDLLRTITHSLGDMDARAALFDARVFILMTLTRQTLEAEECVLFPVLRSGRLRRPLAELADSIAQRRAELMTAHQLLMGLHELDTPTGSHKGDRHPQSEASTAPPPARRPWLLRMMAGG